MQLFLEEVIPAQRGCTVLVGVHASPVDFCLAALACMHPFDRHLNDEALLTCTFMKFSSPSSDVASRRRQRLRFWHDQADHLVCQEHRLHAAMNKEVEQVMSPKRLLIFGSMLRSLAYPQVDSLLSLLSGGFPLVGAFPCTESLPPRLRDADLCLEDLWRRAPQIQQEIIERASQPSDPELAEQLFKLTCEEVDRGWLAGPFSRAEVDARHRRWVPALRFPVVQNGKMRAVDDFSGNFVNSAFSATETVEPSDLDYIAAHAKVVIAACSHDPAARAPGTPLHGLEVQPEYVDSEIQGKLWDLASAYRQLAVAPKHRSVAIICLIDPSSGVPAFFELWALPFGAAASVLGFNWVTHALTSILVGIFELNVTNFYDDYFMLEPTSLVSSARETMEGVMQLLGWSLKPLHDFSSRPEPLGSVVDLSSSSSGTISISNKSSRVTDIVAIIDDVLSSSQATPATLASLQGKLIHARAQCLGRFGGVALRCLYQAQTRGGRARALDPEVVAALRNLRLSLTTARPRRLRAVPAPPLVIFCDGMAEGEYEDDGYVKVGVGGIMLDPVDRAFRYFADVVPNDITDSWRADGSQQIIHQGELLPQLIARMVWARRCAGRNLLIFVDNEGSKAALVKGMSKNSHSALIVEAVVALDISDDVHPWYARVPSASNLADAPSRGEPVGSLPGWPDAARTEVLWNLVRTRMRSAGIQG